MIVPVDSVVMTAPAPEPLGGQVRDHLVRVPVDCGTTAAVNQVNRELVVGGDVVCVTSGPAACRATRRVPAAQRTSPSIILASAR